MAATTLTDRAVVRLSGENVHGFLQGLVTNDVAAELPVWAGLLTPQGKCLFDFIVWADGEDLLLDCAAEAADDLVKRLTIYRLRRPIRIGREPGIAVHWSLEGNVGSTDPLAVGDGIGGAGDRRSQVGHDDGPGKLARGVPGDRLQHRTVAQMDVPVVGTADSQRLGHAAAMAQRLDYRQCSPN